MASNKIPMHGRAQHVPFYRSFRITNTVSGVDLGTYQAEDEQGALDAMAVEAGYRNYADACSVAPVLDRELRVEQVQVCK